MKQALTCLVLMAFTITTFGQEIKGKSNTVHLELNSSTHGKPTISWIWPEQISTQVDAGKVVVKAGIRSSEKIKQIEI